MIESACAERQKVVCLFLSWSKSHVVPTISICRVRASVLAAGCLLPALVFISCNFIVLPNFLRCNFWVGSFFCSRDICIHGAYFDSCGHVCRIIFSLGVVILPVRPVWCFFVVNPDWLPRVIWLHLLVFPIVLLVEITVALLFKKRDIAPSCLAVTE